MRATMLDLRRRTKEVLQAVERNEHVVLTRHGKEICTMVPTGSRRPPKLPSAREDPSFGMYKDRPEMKNPTEYIERLRRRKRYVI